MNAPVQKFGHKQGVGQSVLRKEDAAFIKGEGCYTADITKPDQLYGFVLRSPVGAGRFQINSIEEASAVEGVALILTGADVAHLGSLKSGMMKPQPDGSVAPTLDIPILCVDRVQHIGDAVAFIVARSLAIAEEAAELIDIEYQGADTVTDTLAALNEGAPLVWPEHGSNIAYINEHGDRVATGEAFSKAAHVSRLTLINNRLVCNYMETRAAIGEFNAAENLMTLTTGTQGVHAVRDRLQKDVFGGAHDMRAITPDVGGGFGTKVFTYREYALVLEAARRLNRPVKWVGSRSEHFLTDAHGRDTVVTAEMAMDKDGKFLGLRVDEKAAMGGYIHQFGPMIPGFSAMMVSGVYDVPCFAMTITGVYTNTCPTDAYRGAGRPEAAYVIERLVDQCAFDLDISRTEIRRRNFIKPEQMPYKTASGRLYDVGEFEANMDQALKSADWDGFEERRNSSTNEGKLRGIGIATYIEACAFAGSEPAFVKLQDDGTIELRIGTQSNGQGHKTAYAQFLSDVLSIDIDRIDVLQGDTNFQPKGGGTGGSRSIPLGGVSVRRAGDELARKMKLIAADMLEASSLDIELEDGAAHIVGTDRHVSYAQIAAHADEPLRADGEFKQAEATYPNGTHICEVEIDPNTGTTEICSYTIVDDFGYVVNPMLLEGQVHGGVAQAIGQALHERTYYDGSGQLLTASFMDYAMPRADDIPNFKFETRNVPSTTNAMGIKGAGEAGTIGGCPAVMSAVVDALKASYGIDHIDMPATPQHVWNVIHAVKA